MVVSIKQGDEVIVSPYVRRNEKLHRQTKREEAEKALSQLEAEKGNYTRKEFRAKMKEICGGDMGLFHKWHDKTDWSLGVFKDERV